MSDEKLQKLLANAGLGSRRQMEKVIAEGRVMVNNVTATIGDRATRRDDIRCDGKPVRFVAQKRPRVLLYNKPEGEICTLSDPEGRKTVFQQLPKIANSRWISVGRLDINSSGLLLFTTDGEFAQRLMRPQYAIEREYTVRVIGEVKDSALSQLLKGVELDDGRAKFEKLSFSGGAGVNSWYHVTLTEGRNREVRRLWQAVGCSVNRLIRIRFGNIALPRNLPTGKWVELEKNAINQLMELVRR